MSDNKLALNTRSNMPVVFDREAELARMAEHVAKVQADHPDQDLNVSSQWWIPAIDLKASMQVCIRNERIAPLLLSGKLLII
jgi:hypothetical protein